ncbi:MAG: YncE family protein [Weeksellaceae bacterium]
MRYFSQLFVSFFVLLNFTACVSSDNDIDKPDVKPIDPYHKVGVLISNEGNFMSANASIDFLHTDGELETNVFKNANPDILLGDVLQGTFVDEDYTYLVMNNSNKVEVVDRNTFKIVATITENLKLPRYLTVTDDYIFVTNNHSTYAGESGGYITIYNKKTFDYFETIELPQQVEKIFSNDQYVYVQQSYFSDGNKITKIDAKTLQVLEDIELDQNFRDISWGTGNFMYAVSNSETDCNEFYSCEDEDLTITIYQIDKNTGKVLKNWNFDQYVINIDHYYDEKVYFTTTNAVYYIDTRTQGSLPKLLIETEKNEWSNFYGFSVLKDKIYLSNVNGFIAASDVYIYNDQGSLLSTFKAGRGVNDFYLYE